MSRGKQRRHRHRREGTSKISYDPSLGKVNQRQLRAHRDRKQHEWTRGKPQIVGSDARVDHVVVEQRCATCGKTRRHRYERKRAES